ncbi:Mur ligase [Russula ochroleuca]|uniref:Mur ligase n=1 Tax=Russula ochroleuca TaxID=152965 RepID=A0A9P5MTI8_9AGAM|nr:Mur ligase [Russula ochroleuca]
MDLSLGRIKVLLSHLPQYTLPTIHIAGTNGKGSVSSFVASILQASGFRVGSFNSPHLISVLDSIIINGEPVGSDLYNGARRLVEDINSGLGIEATSFELLTATVLMLFESAKLDIVVLEVGMGGLTDATNAVPDDVILVSALTAVDLDHQKFLGDTVGAIARQKAGIARKGRPFVVGPQKYPDVMVSVRIVVEEEVGAELVCAGPAATRTWDEAVDGPPEPAVRATSSLPFRRPAAVRPVSLSLPCFPDPVLALLPLQGDHQLDNLGVAASIVSSLLTHSYSTQRLPFGSRITPSTIAAGIRSTSWAGRLSFHDVPLSRLGGGTEDPDESLVVLVDGAHNPASASVLASYMSHLLESTPVGGSEDLNLTFVLALSDSPPKTPLQTLSPLLSFERAMDVKINLRAAALEFTPVEGMPWVRPVPSSEIRDVIKEIDGDIGLWTPREGERESVANALLWAHEEHQRHGGKGFVCIAGSLYLVADFYREYE